MTQNSSIAPLMKTGIDFNFVFVHELSESTHDVFNLIAQRAFERSWSRHTTARPKLCPKSRVMK